MLQMNLKQFVLDFRPPKIARLLLMIALLLHWLTPSGQWQLFSNFWVAGAFALGGFIVMMWGWWLFRKFDTAVCPTEKNTYLVTSGIYQFSRNPMYLGMTLILAAFALLLGSVPLYAMVIIYFLIIHYVFCPYEENKLIDTFGDTYRQYQTQVRRWI